MAIILGKKIYGRLETLEYANKKFQWSDMYFIGISCFYGFWAWLLARLTHRKCIYYCIDFYSPEIADNLWDSIFIWSAMKMDKFLCKHCDKVWDISKNINKGREVFENTICLSDIVPLSYPSSYFRYIHGDKNKIVFVGIEPYGLELLDNYVWLRGLPLDKLLDELSKSGIGIALWKRNGNNYYGDPGKTKLYSACGLPVITTPNTEYAKIIEKTNAGIVVEYDRKQVAKAIRKIIKNYSYYKRNVKKTWKYIDAKRIFGNKKLLE